MSAIVTALIPSRDRPKRCNTAILSLFDTAPMDDFEVIVRLDYDEPQMEAYQAVCGQFVNVFIESGPRHNGWYSCHLFYSEMADKATTPWVMLWNDDVIMEGKGWTDQLRSVPTRGFIVQQETHRLGGSTYLRSPGGPFPIVPTGCWKAFGYQNIPPEPDKALDGILRLVHGWQTHWLTGIALNHQRDNDEQLMEHRKL